MSVAPAESTPTDPAVAAEPPVATATPEPAKADPPKTEPKANPWDDPEAARAEIERLRRENGSERVNAKAQAAEEARKELAQTIGKALGLVEDEQIDPAKLTESLTAAQQQARQAQVALAVYQNAGAVGDPVALLDSTTFLTSVADIDPSDTAAISAAIEAAVAANPRLGAAPANRAPAPNPAQGSSANGPAAPAQLTVEDVRRLSAAGQHDEIEKARQEGRLDAVLGIK